MGLHTGFCIWNLQLVLFMEALGTGLRVCRTNSQQHFARASCPRVLSIPYGGIPGASLIVGLLPLTLLTPKLAQIRIVGLWNYGKLATQYTEAFQRKWVHAAEQASEPLLGTSDIQSLADLGNSYSLVRDMNFAPITKMLVIQLAVQAGLPLLLVVILGTPTSELVRATWKMVI